MSNIVDEMRVAVEKDHGARPLLKLLLEKKEVGLVREDAHRALMELFDEYHAIEPATEAVLKRIDAIEDALDAVMAVGGESWAIYPKPD
jgi:hypothetical protein